MIFVLHKTKYQYEYQPSLSKNRQKVITLNTKVNNVIFIQIIFNVFLFIGNHQQNLLMECLNYISTKGSTNTESKESTKMLLCIGSLVMNFL